MPDCNRLFVPLNNQWYNLFLSRTKKWEIRGYSPRFNEKTVKIGQTVELRNGYQKKGALWGVITEIHIIDSVYGTPDEITKELFPISNFNPLWHEIYEYEKKYNKFIVFKVELDDDN